MERWCAHLQEHGVSGIPFWSCVDGQLFQRSKHCTDPVVTDGEFAYNAALFASSHTDAESKFICFAVFSLLCSVVEKSQCCSLISGLLHSSLYYFAVASLSFFPFLGVTSCT